LFTADPRKDPEAKLLSQVQAGDPTLESIAGGAGSSIGKGGMITKVLAAKRAASSGAHTVVAWGREPQVLPRLAHGESIGTWFAAHTPRIAARKQWLADHLQVRGRLVLDAGAVKALRDDGKSLLPIGVADVQGEFERGEVVSCLDASGREVARGLVNYASTDARKIARKPSSAIESVLGFCEAPELIHRSNLVIT
jgi:glutamate 5-kinase